MKKKAPAKRVTDKAKKEELLKRVKASLSKPSKAAVKKKETTKAPPEKKIAPKKVKAKIVKKTVKVEKEKVGKTVKKVSPGKRTPVKKIEVIKKKKETLPKAVKKKAPSKAAAETVRGKKVVKKEKAPKTGIKVKDKKALPLRAEKKEKPASGKAGKLKAASKPETKTGKKSVKRTTEKVRKTFSPEVAKKEKKIEVPKTAGRMKKTKKETAIKPVIKRKKAKKEKDIIKEFKGVGEVNKGKIGKMVKEIRQPVEIEEPENLKKDKECRSVSAEKWPPIPFDTLPSEYGENGITLMVVNPSKLFAFWEVREDTLQIFQGDLTIRIYDITGVDFESMDANSCIDMAVNYRIGDVYISVSPGKDYIADIGIVYSEGIFITVARSLKVSTPHETLAEEKDLSEEFADVGLRVGY
jgi:hypothetical protein